MRRRDGNNRVVALGLLVAVIGLVSFLAFSLYNRISQKRIRVVVTKADLPAGTRISEKNAKMISTRHTEQISEATVTDLATIKGRPLLRAKQRGQLVYSTDFILNKPPTAESVPLAELVPEGRLLSTLTLSGMTFPPKALHRGDRLDIITPVKDEEGVSSTKVMVYDAFFVGYLSPPSGRPQSASAPSSRQRLLDVRLPEGAEGASTKKTALLLALYPEDMIPLAEINTKNVPYNLVLHGKKEVLNGELLSIKNPRRQLPEPLLPEVKPKTVELIVGGKSSRVVVEDEFEIEPGLHVLIPPAGDHL